MAVCFGRISVYLSTTMYCTAFNQPRWLSNLLPNGGSKEIDFLRFVKYWSRIARYPLQSGLALLPDFFERFVNPLLRWGAPTAFSEQNYRSDRYWNCHIAVLRCPVFSFWSPSWSAYEMHAEASHTLMTIMNFGKLNALPGQTSI